MKRSALGKGIGALIPEAPTLRPGATPTIPVADIQPNPQQPRRHFESDRLAELVESIREHGVLQPVLVTRSADGKHFLLAGERRWRAAKAAGLERIPAVVRDGNTDLDQLTLALIENLQREDLTPIEEARAYHQLRADLGLSQEDIARRMGKDRSTIANALRLLHLPLGVQEMVDSGALSAGHARCLAGLSDGERQRELAERCVRDRWSVREVERRIQPAAPRAGRVVDPETNEAADRLSLALGARVEIHRRRRGGEVRIGFSSEQELIRLFKALTGERQ